MTTSIHTQTQAYQPSEQNHTAVTQLKRTQIGTQSSQSIIASQTDYEQKFPYQEKHAKMS